MNIQPDTLIRPATPADIPAWFALRATLWPDYTHTLLATELRNILANPNRAAAE